MKGFVPPPRLSLSTEPVEITRTIDINYLGPVKLLLGTSRKRIQWVTAFTVDPRRYAPRVSRLRHSCCST